MEFKVWVDGIQRVISGVNNETTCRDIVLCLAQATHQFGKFVLIEKWRNSERLLAPSESPLQLMNKWADYGNEVCFVMRRSDYHQQIQQQQTQQTILQRNQPKSASNLQSNGLGSTAPINYHSNTTLMQHHLQTQLPASGQPQLQPLPPPTNLTSAMRHSPGQLYGTYAANGTQSPIHHQPQSKFTAAGTSGQCSYGRTTDSLTSDETGKTGNVRPKRPPPYNEAIAKSSLLQSQSPVLGQSSQSPNLFSVSSQQLAQQQPYTSQVPITQQPQQQQQPPLSSGSSYGYGEQQGVPKNIASMYGPPASISNGRVSNNPYGEIGIPHVLSNRNLNGLPVDYRNGSDYDNRTGQNVELDKLHKRKKNVIEKGTLTDLHGAQTIYGENSFNHLYGVQKTTRPWDDKEVAQLTAQEQLVINDEIQNLNREKERIELEKNQLNSNLNETDSKIAKCRQRIQQLMDDIREMTAARNNERIKREEENAKDQLNTLKKQICQSLQDFETASQELNSLQDEMDKLDCDLNERKKKIEKLTTEIKEANIEGLTLLPLEDGLGATENENHPPDCSSGDNRFAYRLGSTRRISGSPRELGTAAPTSKNPHGVWV